MAGNLLDYLSCKVEVRHNGSENNFPFSHKIHFFIKHKIHSKDNSLGQKDYHNKQRAYLNF